MKISKKLAKLRAPMPKPINYSYWHGGEFRKVKPGEMYRLGMEAGKRLLKMFSEKE